MQSPAKAMQAMDLDIREAKEFIRISFGRSTTMDDVLKLGQNIVNVVKEYKANSVI
jgi:cysteine desulfurase